MSLPNGVKIKKGNVEYVSNFDKAQYTIKELTRAALRDVGKLIVARTRKKARKRTGVTKKGIQYWVRAKQENPDLQVGYKPSAWKGLFYELGAAGHNISKEAWLYSTVQESIDDIRRIEGQYLSAIEDENRALGLINESDYEGGEDNE